MQILWREVFGGDRPLTMNEFLFYYKPSEIHQSLGFYQFTARGTDCRLIKSLALSDRNRKKEFFFVFGFWARSLMDVGRDTFGRCIGDLGNLRPEGKSLPPFSSFHSLLFTFSPLFTCFFTAVKRPSLSKFHRDHVHRTGLHVDRSFHSLVTLG